VKLSSFHLLLFHLHEKIFQNVLMDGWRLSGGKATRFLSTTHFELEDVSHRSAGMSTTGDRERPSPSFVKAVDANGSAGRWLLCVGSGENL
jgi:hypothetical protein